MSENILSLEDLKFLERLHNKCGLIFLRMDDDGIQTNSDLDTVCDGENMSYLSEISKKLKYRLNSNFQMNFTSDFNFDVVRV